MTANNATVDLDRLLTDYRTAIQCVARLAQTTRVQQGACDGAVSTVVVICEHEHVYDVRLCETHVGLLGQRPRLGCPLCRSGLDDWLHRCRHMQAATR